MNREFKFRSWQGKTMHYFDFYDIMNRGFDPTGYGVFDAVNMQYTGIKDKYGVEIYEGDIVDYGAFDLSVIKYEDGTYWARLGQYPLNVVHRDIEVKGNIYENLELLTQ
ncbi:YopX family protein [Bacillus sp. FJAT-22090]|uniref:YopX family protein n=1 Tax=Bacillus sp. FJAT-22090 TaxID=1581038 RepID=UPI0016428617|nr:YopX family protein [Bacillus sp. FJAT-22090]